MDIFGTLAWGDNYSQDAKIASLLNRINNLSNWIDNTLLPAHNELANKVSLLEIKLVNVRSEISSEN